MEKDQISLQIAMFTLTIRLESYMSKKKKKIIWIDGRCCFGGALFSGRIVQEQGKASLISAWIPKDLQAIQD